MSIAKYVILSLELIDEFNYVVMKAFAVISMILCLAFY